MVERYRLDDARELTTFFGEWRKAKGWTQQQLADKLRTTKQTVSRIETGERDWSKGYVEAFGHVIGCHPLAPLLSRPNDGVDVSAILNVLEIASLLSDADLAEVSKSMQSLARASGREPNPAARAPISPKLKENP